MAQPTIPSTFFADIKKQHTCANLAIKYGVSIRTTQRWKKYIIDSEATPTDFVEPTVDENKLVYKQNLEIQSLKKTISELQSSAHNLDEIYDVLYKASKFEYQEKVLPDFSTMNEKVNGVPVLMLSDIHYSENVNPAEVGFVNEYNSAISNTRINFTVDSAIKIILHDWTAYHTDWFVLPLIGDIVSGAIHDELAESNDKRILVATLEIADILIYQIKKLKQHFNHVYVPCVVGNHGRLHKKPRAKGFVQENYEYVVYKLIEREFSDDESVIVHVSESPDLRFDIFGKRFLMTHGNTLGGGGNGIAGILPLLYRGNYKKQERETSVNNSYDVLLIGHYHTSLFLGKVIVNGTTKGVDEYALNFLNIGYEPPSQNLFMVDRNFNDITYRLPIFCEPSDNIQIEHTIKTYV